MRPLRLEIEGFTAFRDKQEIDFESLDLFVITGPTGAGKTSILDAMVFALYGKVPRIGGKHGTADLISLGRVHSQVLFEFSVAAKGRYRVARRMSRRAAQTATLERLEGTSWINVLESGRVTECNERLLELLGLEFDSFCKAVVLPQGEFHRFLKGDPAERREVLVSLLGVGYFQQMGKLAGARQRTLEAGTARVQELIDERYQDATQDRLGELRVAVGETAKRAAALSSALAEAEKLDQRSKEHAAAATVLDTARGELADIAVELRSEIDACREAEGAKKDVATALSAAAAELEARRSAASQASEAAAAVEAETGPLEALVAAAEALAAVRDADQEIAEARGESEVAAAARATAEQSLKAAQDAAADAQDAHGGAVEAEGSRRAESDAAQKQTLALELAVRQAESRAAEEAEALAELEAVRAEVGTRQETAATSRAELDAAIARLDEHRRQHQVAELASGLAIGDPCPVCERELESAISIAPDATDALSSAHTDEAQARTRAEDAGREAAAAEARAREVERRADASAKGLVVSLGDFGDLATLRAAAEEAAAAAATCDGALRAATAAREQAQAKSETANAAADATLREVDRLTAVQDAADRSVASGSQRRARAMDRIAEHFGGSAPDEAAERVAADRERLDAAQASAKSTREAVDAAAAAHAEAAQAVEAAERRLIEVDLRLTQLRTQVESIGRQAAARLKEIHAPALAATPAAASAASREAATSELASWCEASADAVAAGAAETLAAAEAVSAEVAALATAHEVAAPSADSALAALRGAERAAATSVVRAESAVEEAERRLQEREDMEARIAEDREQISILAALSLELRADRFGEFIVKETLDLLAVRASDELKRISDGRYSLTQVDGDFVVVDHANADETRSVKTLSGGETFLASLSLALALSAHVGELAAVGLGAKLEAVFIDEGFGTLDPDTLEEVIDALERLRAADLLVGVISHVPVLAQRVRAGLEVHKVDGGSVVRPAVAA